MSWELVEKAGVAKTAGCGSSCKISLLALSSIWKPARLSSAAGSKGRVAAGWHLDNANVTVVLADAWLLFASLVATAGCSVACLRACRFSMRASVEKLKGAAIVCFAVVVFLATCSPAAVGSLALWRVKRLWLGKNKFRLYALE